MGKALLPWCEEESDTDTLCCRQPMMISFSQCYYPTLQRWALSCVLPGTGVLAFSACVFLPWAFHITSFHSSILTQPLRDFSQETSLGFPGFLLPLHCGASFCHGIHLGYGHVCQRSVDAPLSPVHTMSPLLEARLLRISTWPYFFVFSGSEGRCVWEKAKEGRMGVDRKDRIV